MLSLYTNRCSGSTKTLNDKPYGFFYCINKVSRLRRAPNTNKIFKAFTMLLAITFDDINFSIKTFYFSKINMILRFKIRYCHYMLV